MQERRRAKMLTILEDRGELLPFLYQVDRLKRCDDILDYLLRNNLTGKRLLAYYQEQNRSFLHLMADILRRVDKLKSKQKLFRKDFING